MDQTPDKDPRGLTRRRLLKTAAAGALALALPRARAAGAKRAVKAPDRLLPPLPADRIAPLASRRVLPFDLADVRLGDGPFKRAQARDGAYLLFLEPDRLLHGFLANAGLPPKGALYGGWEGQGVAGHIGGHYLSACSQMYRATGDPRFRARADYLVSELARCQAQSSDGLTTAIPDARAIFARVARDGAMTGWVPWYTMHKLFAGLRDSYQLCGNAQARGVLVRLSDWAIATTKNLTEPQMQAMLETEHGGMAESLADVYAITGDAKYLALARRFTHRAVFDPLAARRDALDGLHSNTQIPKMLGYDRIHQLTGDAPYGEAPHFFWQTVTKNRTYANGGNGDYEHFFPPADFKSHVQSDVAAETCCSYNMLKLTGAQFARDPQAHYADFHERTLFNHILASQDPDGGGMSYYTPMKPGHTKIYSGPADAFWCCVGTGLENHAKYGDSVYFRAADDHALYVNQFLASTLRWRGKGLTLTQATRFPEADTVRLSLACPAPTAFTLKIRRPFWADGMTVSVNGTPADARPGPDGYVSLRRTWRGGDAVDVRLPMAVRLEPLPGAPEKQAVLFGPLLLVGALGREGLDKMPDVGPDAAPYDNRPALPGSAFVGDPADVAARIRPVAGQVLTFQTAGLGRPNDVTLRPTYLVHHQRQNTYWSVYSPADWARRKADLARAEAERRALDARTLDRFLPGNQQSEVDHRLQSLKSGAGEFSAMGWRDASDGGWFEFVLKTDGAGPLTLLCTYWGSDTGGREFDVLVDGTKIGTQTLDNDRPGELFDVSYPVPPARSAGKAAITVRLQAKPGLRAGGLFGCRLLRAAPAEGV